MHARKITDSVFLIGVVDWHRRLFDSLIPLPDGTSYNAYLIKGSEKTALIDSVDPAFTDTLMEELKEVASIDYVVCHHTEQDHSGSIPAVLAKYPKAQVLCTEKCKGFAVDHLHISPERIRAVTDNESVSLGNKTLTFVHTPWVHWPETMVTWLKEDKVLFTCDFFGSHYATSSLFVPDEAIVYESAKRYYAEIMMPFRATIKNNLAKVEKFDIATLAPSHGPVYDRPAFIMDAYRDWISDMPKNSLVLPFISMHGSTAKMVDRLTTSLVEKGVEVQPFDLAATDIGKLAISLVDAATVVLGTPTVHVGPHPMVAYAAMLANALKPKARYVSIIGSYGWATKAVEQLAGAIGNLKVEVVPPVLCKGLPREADYQALDGLAAAIADKHRQQGLLG
ncbi:MAG: FprA family A-type flavoprotein [Fibrobacterota bacterium]